jgi:hypothetical protein
VERFRLRPMESQVIYLYIALGCLFMSFLWVLDAKYQMHGHHPWWIWSLGVVGWPVWLSVFVFIIVRTIYWGVRRELSKNTHTK